MLDLEELRISNVPEVVIISVTTLRDYEIEGFIDKGNNSYVFTGRNVLSGQRVALKYYYGSHEEVQLLAPIQNDNVLRVLGAHSVDQDYSYYITPEITYGDIDEAISSKSLSLREGVEVVKGVLQGLVPLHSSGLVHRDLKPANLLLGDNKQPIIADFGSVKAIPDGADHVNASRHAQLYKPPEAHDFDSYFCSSDLYQVGLVMFQVLYGYLPYDPSEWLSNRQLQVFLELEPYERSVHLDRLFYRRAKARELAKVSTLPEYIPKALVGVIQTALRPDHTKRFQTCSGFLGTLHNLGVMPDWKELGEGEVVLYNFHGLDYRIIRDGNVYKAQKKRSNLNNWRNIHSIRTGAKGQVINQLKTVLELQ